jgi:hypothetical protein
VLPQVNGHEKPVTTAASKSGLTLSRTALTFGVLHQACFPLTHFG